MVSAERNAVEAEQTYRQLERLAAIPGPRHVAGADTSLAQPIQRAIRICPTKHAVDASGQDVARARRACTPPETCACAAEYSGESSHTQAYIYIDAVDDLHLSLHPPPSSTHRRGHYTYSCLESDGVSGRVLTEPVTHVFMQQRAAFRALRQVRCVRAWGGQRTNGRPCASVRAPVGKAPHWARTAPPSQRHLSARRRARPLRSSC